MTGWRDISLCGHLRHTCSATEFIWSEAVGILLGAGMQVAVWCLGELAIRNNLEKVIMQV